MGGFVKRAIRAVNALLTADGLSLPIACAASSPPALGDTTRGAAFDARVYSAASSIGQGRIVTNKRSARRPD